jgi:flagellar hook-length control protein FliK
MEAIQIAMVPTVTAPAMTTAVNMAVDSVSAESGNSFGKMLGQRMNEQQESVAQTPTAQPAATTSKMVRQNGAESETAVEDSHAVEADTTMVTQMAAMYAQLTAHQLGVTVQQQVSDQLASSAESATASSATAVVAGKELLATNAAESQMVQVADTEPKAHELAAGQTVGGISPGDSLTSSGASIKTATLENKMVFSQIPKVADLQNSGASTPVANGSSQTIVAKQNFSNEVPKAAGLTQTPESVAVSTETLQVAAAKPATSTEMSKLAGLINTDASNPEAAEVSPASAAKQTLSKVGADGGLLTSDLQIPPGQTVSPTSVTTQGVSKDVAKGDILSANVAATTESATNLTDSNKIQSNPMQTAVTGQPAEELNQPDSNKLKREATVQVVVSAKVQAPDTAVSQKVAEAQIVPQELSAGTKNSSAAALQTVRFAQPADVMIATADSGSQGNLSSDSGSQNAQLAPKLVKSVAIQPEVVFAGFSTEQASITPNAELQLINPQTGHQVIAAGDAKVSVLTDNVATEQVGRQVLERLASHEIKQGNDQITLKLSPENLGNLQVNLRMDNQRLNLEIVAETRGVRDAILQQQDELKATLSRQNIQMESFSVTTGSNNGNSSQQSRDWRQMAAEQQLSQYASTRSTSNSGSSETSIKYFVPQYQSTLDVRF